MKSQLRDFRRFLRQQGFSQNYAAMQLDISQPSLSKLLRGSAGHIREDHLSQLLNRMQGWMDEVNDAEHKLYLRLAPICRDVPGNVAKSTLKKLLSDLQQL